MRMPKSEKFLKPTLYQVARHRKEKELMGMCVPNLSAMAPDYGIKTVHYLAKIISEMGR